ncbi:hypothetical protein AAV29_02190 [Bacillus velezensis]|nr:hypothetical protein AAV29_02190 [Bacillus velezensis]
MWKESGGTKKLKDIADELGVTSSTVRKWKANDKWEEKINGSAPKSKGSAPFRPGAPKGNKNARGNRGGKAPRIKFADTVTEIIKSAASERWLIKKLLKGQGVCTLAP